MCSEYQAVNKMSARDYGGKVYINFFTTGVTPSSYLSQFRNYLTARFVCHKSIFTYLLEKPTGTMSDRGQRKHLGNNFKENIDIQGTVFSTKKNKKTFLYSHLYLELCSKEQILAIWPTEVPLCSLKTISIYRP